MMWAGWWLWAWALAWAGSGPLAGELDPTLDAAAVRDAEVGVMVVRVRDGAVVYDHRGDVPMVPASTAKLLTAAAALHHLGPSYAWVTELRSSADVRGGVLEGDLVLRGTGDPTLVVEKLWRMFRDLRADGVRRIRGDILLDDTHLVDEPLIPGWDKEQDLEDGPSYFPTLGALSVEFGSAEVVVVPADEPGGAATIALESPASPWVTVEGEVTTVARGARLRLELERKIDGDRVTFVLSGRVPADGEARRYRRAVPSPTWYVAGIVRDLLRELDIRHDGRMRRAEASDDARVLRRLYSPPLTSVLMDTNKYSSNFMAELVLRTLGAEVEGEGSTAAGVRAVRRYLDAIGVAPEDAVLVNGSGLARDARLTPAALTAVLLDMARNPRVGHEFATSLAIAGRDGTLIRRLDELAGRLRGKTGTLGGVHGLAGYAEASDGEVYAFAFLANAIRGSLHPIKDVQDGFLRRLAAARSP
jgi:D-alanyl-D-alanine carboxypeptidase/D-alanyl-D-alanine-endopeptidase (penicillin-binding protein 4)